MTRRSLFRLPYAWMLLRGFRPTLGFAAPGTSADFSENRMKRYSENPLRDRNDVQKLVRDLVAPLSDHFSPGCAQVHLGENRALFGDPGGWLEGFARPLWGLVPLQAGGGGFPFLEKWKLGLQNGTDPNHSEYWGLAGDFDQRSVEQAAFGLALTLAPEAVWDPLSDTVKRNLVAWLSRINEVKLVESNWLFFRVLVNFGLRARGQTWSRARVQTDLDHLEKFHLGNGWYIDGFGGDTHRDGRTGDYYVPMGFQYYSLLYARLAKDDDPERCRRFIERARSFAEDFQYYFAEDGAALPFGRSLTYRFAQGAFWGALAFANVDALPWGVIKGLYLRHLRWWMKQPIFSDTGLLTVGYTYPNYVMGESYNSPGSPYWAFKAFLPLSLPEDHPFWTAAEAPLPRRRRVHTIPSAKLILVTEGADRQITAINPGQSVFDWPRHAPQKYSKFAYSTRFGFAVATSSATPAEGGLDSAISISDDGRVFHTREHCVDAEVANGVAFSRWKPWPDVELQMWVLAELGGHLRITRISTERKLWSVDAGFALAYTDKRTRHLLPDSQEGPTVRTTDVLSRVQDLLGNRLAECAELGANGHLFKSLSAMPLLRGQHVAGIHWLVTWTHARASGETGEADNVEYRAEISGSNLAVYRKGARWWSCPGSDCGLSSPERLAFLEEKV